MKLLLIFVSILCMITFVNGKKVRSLMRKKKTHGISNPKDLTPSVDSLLQKMATADGKSAIMKEYGERTETPDQTKSRVVKDDPDETKFEIDEESKEVETPIIGFLQADDLLTITDTEKGITQRGEWWDHIYFSDGTYIGMKTLPNSWAITYWRVRVCPNHPALVGRGWNGSARTVDAARAFMDVDAQKYLDLITA